MTEKDLEQKVRQEIADDIRSLTLEELEELQEWLEGKKAAMKAAYIQSINSLISDMTARQLDKIEDYIANIED